MKFYLKNNRSEQFSYFSDKWYCVGRENEIHSLQHVLKNLNSSSILISGVRWTWKTSFVHKAIKWLSDNFIPIFINLKDIKDIKATDKWAKTHLLTSIIRATYLSDKKFTDKFTKRKDLENMYYNSLWQFEIFEEHITDDKKEKSEKDTAMNEFKASLHVNNIVKLIWCFLTVYGCFFPEQLRLKWLLTTIWIWTISIDWTKIFEHFKETLNSLTKNRKKWLKWKIENSQEFLEIEFEKWLKEQQDQKIIFIIDEMDKLWDPEEVLQILKEQKNLFTRACAHFLFITDESFYDLVNNWDRKNKKTWIFPTIFSHVYYLPTPQFEDLQKYLNDIIETEITGKNNEEFEKLKSYLLFNSLNDYFLLKKLIHDNLEYEWDKIFLSLDTIKNQDKNFEDKVNIYNYINKSLEKFIYNTKWKRKDNADLINYVYDFLNNNLWNNFNRNDIKYDYFLEILSRWWLITNLDDNFCAWTGKYNNIESAHALYSYENEFLSNFKEMIKIANDLNDYKEVLIWNQPRFKTYTNIEKWRDWTNIANISLYTIYEKHKKLYNDLRNNNSVYKIKKEDTENANKEVKLNIDNIKNSIPTIIANITTQIITKPLTISNATVTMQNPHVFNKFNQFPIFKSEVQNTQHSVFWIWDKIVLIINKKDGEQNEILKDRNEVFLLKWIKNILVIDLNKTSNNIWIKNKSYTFINETDKRKREKGTIDNYYIVNYNDIRDLKSIFPKIKTFLEN